jgi:hypothetical protein
MTIPAEPRACSRLATQRIESAPGLPLGRKTHNGVERQNDEDCSGFHSIAGRPGNDGGYGQQGHDNARELVKQDAPRSARTNRLNDIRAIANPASFNV